MSSPVRSVLMVLHRTDLNGATIAALRPMRRLEERGWSFRFWVPGPGEAAEHLAGLGYEVAGREKPLASSVVAMREGAGLMRRLAASPGYVRSFQRHLRETKPALVHANSLYAYEEALIARIARRPTLLHVHEMAPVSRKAGAAAAVCRRAAGVCVAVSEACARSYARDGWSPRVVYESADVPFDRVEIRTRPRPFVVGTVGVVAPRKGSDLFVEAARRVMARTDQVEFRLVGTPADPLERAWGDRVLAEAAEAGVVHIPRTDVDAELRRWDAFALPSRTDPCPLAMLEAMALGLPVIGTRRDGLAEQIRPGCGVLVPPEDPRALADAILAMTRLSPAARSALGSAARARVAAAFSVSRQAEGLDRAYRSAIALPLGNLS